MVPPRPRRPHEYDELFRTEVAKTFEKVRKMHGSEKIGVKLQLVRNKHGNISISSIYSWWSKWKNGQSLGVRSSAPKTNPRRIPPAHVLYLRALWIDRKRTAAQLQQALQKVGLKYSVHGISCVLKRALLPQEVELADKLVGHEDISPLVTDGICSEKLGLREDFVRALLKFYKDKPDELPGSTADRRFVAARHALGL